MLSIVPSVSKVLWLSAFPYQNNSLLLIHLSLLIMESEPTLFYQSAHTTSTPTVVSASGLYFTLENGQKILDSTCGAAVSAIGHGNSRVNDAIVEQLGKFTYAHPGYFQNTPALELADFLVQSTGGKMSRACLLGSGMLRVKLYSFPKLS